MQTITVANRKGGVGKSSVTTHLAAALGIRGARVLVIDMDSQASTTSMLLESIADDAPTTTQVLLGEARLAGIIQPSTRERVDIAPACSELTRAQFAIVGKTGRETILRRSLRDLTGYDVVLIDTAPELQLATVNALVAATHVLMPFTPDPKALEGLHTTTEAVAEIAAAELAQPRILGCVQVAYDRRLGVTEQAREQVHAAYGELLLDTRIRSNSSFIVCPAWHRDIFAMEHVFERDGLAGGEQRLTRVLECMELVIGQAQQELARIPRCLGDDLDGDGGHAGLARAARLRLRAGGSRCLDESGRELAHEVSFTRPRRRVT
ncbi:MAG: ParA family protein [Deltaproteobacteria bacterium]|nr:ParA family protein [Deltaproteobacteria bacterium]